MRYRPGRVGGANSISRPIFWVVLSMIAWELFQGLHVGSSVSSGTWPLNAFDVIFLVVLPALCAFAFIRLFLVLTQSARGTLNVYAALSSPWAWVFWLGICIAMLGQGAHLAGYAIWRQVDPGIIRGAFATQIEFMNISFGYAVLGLGIFLVTIATLFIGHSTARSLMGLERFLFIAGSVVTYGVLGVIIGVGADQAIATIAVTATLTVSGFLLMPPTEVTYDPIAAFIVPGSAVACLIVLIWTLVVGGQPTFG